MATFTEQMTDILLMGKTGNGKSSTANSILGRQAFATSSDASPHLWHAQTAMAYYNDHPVRVVEAPGMCHTARYEGRTKKEISREFGRVFYLCKNGLDVMVLVLRFGARFTPEEMRVVNTVKTVFGPDFLQKRCILVFTMGEMFDLEQSTRDEMTFNTWVRNQEGRLKDLVEECQFRFVLFHNKTDHKLEEEKQELFSLIYAIQRKEGEKHDFKSRFGNPSMKTQVEAQEAREIIGNLEGTLTEAAKLTKDIPPDVSTRIQQDIETLKEKLQSSDKFRGYVTKPDQLKHVPECLKKMETDMSNESLRQARQENFLGALQTHIKQCRQWIQALTEMNKTVEKQMQLFSDVLLKEKFLDGEDD